MLTLSVLMQTKAIPATPWELVVESGLETKIVLVVLAVLSLVSWAIMGAKAVEFRKIRTEGKRFNAEFERARRLEDLAPAVRRAPGSPHARVFMRALQFLNESAGQGTPGSAPATRLSAAQVESLRLVLDAQTNSERDGASRFVSWLAIIGSASPLIGLLGTVLGVIDAFLGVAAKGAGNLGAVAPGVGTALTATAAALAVAIPAVFGYNMFATRLNRLDGELDGFGSELIALMVREGRI